MRLGLIARADNTGLGVQTKELYDHLKPAQTFVIDLTEANALMGKPTHNFYDRYPDGIIIKGFPNNDQCKAMLQDIDVLVTVEIPYNYYLFETAKELGVKTVLQYNYEFLDYLQDESLPLPDVLLAPSKWHYDEVKKQFGDRCQVEYLPVPVNTKLIHPRVITNARNFVHIAGHKTYMDRNGTDAVVDCMQYVKSPINLFIHSQFPLPDITHDDRIEVIPYETVNYWDIYNNPNYDVMLLPRRYGGLSLQLNEGLAAGMPVIMTNVEPQNGFLPNEALIGLEGEEKIRTRTLIDCWHPDLQALAAKIDELYTDSQLTETLHREAIQYSQSISWKTMLPKYKKLLES